MVRKTTRLFLALGVALTTGAVHSVRAQTLPPTADGAAIDRDLLSVSATIEALGDRVHRLEAENDGIAPRKAMLTQRARAEVRWLYHLTQGQALALRGGPEALLAHAGQQQHVRRALDGTLHELDAVARRGVSVVAEKDQASAELALAQTRRQQLEAQRREYDVLSGARLAVTNAGLGGGGALVEDLGPSVTVYGGGVAAAVQDAPGFADAMGRLLFPIAGRVQARRGQRAGADGPGLEVLAPVGTPVRAVYAGRVAFADQYGPYGRIVILDHGDRYYTVSANLGAIAVRVGDEVPVGATVGTVGDDGRGAMLFFEVRHGNATLDPGPWIGL